MATLYHGVRAARSVASSWTALHQSGGRTVPNGFQMRVLGPTVWQQSGPRRGTRPAVKAAGYATASAGGSTGRVTVIVATSLVLGLFGFMGYSYLFGPASVYPSEVRQLLREGARAYMARPEKQDLDKAVECYEAALNKLDELGLAGDPKHSPGSPHITGLTGRLAEVYAAKGDRDNAITMYRETLTRIFDHSQLEGGQALPPLQEAKSIGQLIADEGLSKQTRQTLQLALSSAYKLALMCNEKASRDQWRALMLPTLQGQADNGNREAERWFTWCLDVTMHAYQAYVSSKQQKGSGESSWAGGGSNRRRLEMFAPDSLPPWLPKEFLVSIMFEAAEFYTKLKKFNLAIPLLLRSLDLMGGPESKKEPDVCRSAIVMTHLANIAAMQGKPDVMQRWIENGLGKARMFGKNMDCAQSFVALTFDKGRLAQDRGEIDRAVASYRQAYKASQMIHYHEGEKEALRALGALGASV